MQVQKGSVYETCHTDSGGEKYLCQNRATFNTPNVLLTHFNILQFYVLVL